MDAARNASEFVGPLGIKIATREVILHGAHTKEDAVQRATKGLRNAGMNRVRPMTDKKTRALTLLRGRSGLPGRGEVWVRLDPVPEGHRATIGVGQMTAATR